MPTIPASGTWVRRLAPFAVLSVLAMWPNSVRAEAPLPCEAPSTDEAWAACTTAYDLGQLRSDFVVVAFVMIMLTAATLFVVWMKNRGR